VAKSSQALEAWKLPRKVQTCRILPEGMGFPSVAPAVILLGQPADGTYADDQVGQQRSACDPEPGKEGVAMHNSEAQDLSRVLVQHACKLNVSAGH
jgi:hypothetical protein